MQTATLRKEEKLGLAVALAAHGALIIALAINASREPAVIPMPERMVVSLSEDVSLTSTSPDPNAQSQASIAPTLAEQPSPPQAQPEPQPQPEPKPAARPQPAPRATPAPAPTPRPSAQPTPAPRPTPRPAAQPSPRPAAQPTPRPTPRATAQPTPRPTGGSRIGSDFLEGQSSSDRGNARTAPAATFGASEQASLASAISRQLRPHWNAPQGVDVEKLVTIVRFRLNADGSLNGEPRVVSQSGETASNASQKGRHAELAIRAVKLAAPFDLPQEFYQHWKSVDSRFDRNLSR